MITFASLKIKPNEKENPHPRSFLTTIVSGNIAIQD